MPVSLSLTVLAVLVILILCELWWRAHDVQGEFSRKFVHLTVGSFVAFWPFFLSWNEIRLLSLAFLVIVSLSKRLHIFRSIHSIQRPTGGEVFFALSVGLLTFIVHDKWIYAASLLLMGLADGLAAVIGVHASRGQRYKVMGHTKSIPGTLVFFLISLAILFWYREYATVLPLIKLLTISSGATLLENLGIMGLDNLFVPLFAALMLRFI